MQSKQELAAKAKARRETFLASETPEQREQRKAHQRELSRKRREGFYKRGLDSRGHPRKQTVLNGALPAPKTSSFWCPKCGTKFSVM